MTDQDAAIRRARRAWQEALDAPEAGEHPGYEAIEAYVDGKLGADERAAVQQLAAESPEVAQDVADLEEVRRAIADRNAPVRIRQNVRWAPSTALRASGLAAAVAAAVVAAVWIGTGRDPVPVSTVAENPLTTEERGIVDNAVATGRLSPPAGVVALAGQQGTLLGAPDTRGSFRPSSPVATAVLSTRPTFEWTGGDAERYTIALYDESFTEVARGERLNGTSWTPPIDLPRSRTYQWQVTAHRASGDVTTPAPPLPEARFSIVDAKTAEVVAEQRTRLAHVPLALGVLLADSGLMLDARAELIRATEIPATAEAAKKLLESLSLDQGTPTTTKPAQ